MTSKASHKHNFLKLKILHAIYCLQYEGKKPHSTRIIDNVGVEENKIYRMLNHYWKWGYISRYGKRKHYYYKLRKKGIRVLDELYVRHEMGLDLKIISPNPKKMEGGYMVYTTTEPETEAT